MATEKNGGSIPGCHIKQCIDLSIPIPYGQLAAKWWGRRDVRPIVCIHGWQDNAGTFDTLIPLLPEHVGYLAIDLPGHGLSSFQPNGTVYSHVQLLYTLNYVFRKHFGWSRVSLMAHSMGSQLSFLYAATFPDYVDLVIGFDSLKPHVIGEWVPRVLMTSVDGVWRQSDYNNMNGTEPPTYSYDELIDRTVTATGGSVDRESAPYLLQRGTKISRNDAERFFYSRDNRLKITVPLTLTQEMFKRMASQIRCPYLLFKSLESPYSENQEQFRVILEVMQESNTLFELYGVEGGHHVHLTEPDKVARKIVPFIRKFRPVEESLQAKL